MKRLKASGNAHTTLSGALVPAREQAQFACRCNCHEKLSDEEKGHVLQLFNGMADHVSQNMYLASCVIPTEPKVRRSRNEVPRPRRVTYEYYVEVNRGEIVERVRLCQQAFLSFHGIKRSRLKRKVQNDRQDLQDGRGRHHRRSNALSPYVLRQIRWHIASFPARESHYSRKKNAWKKYLDSSLNVRTMHRLFIERYRSMRCVTYEKYLQVFNTKFNISFGYPRSDICDTCEHLVAQIRAVDGKSDAKGKKKLEVSHKLHVSKADSFYSQQADAIKTEDDCCVIAIDFQKNLPLPLTGIGPEYFKRQLWVHNFCVTDMKTRKSTMHLYSEHFAGKGSNEVASCLLSYIEKLDAGVRRLKIFADNCFAQNKNRVLFVVLQSVVVRGRLESIEINYPVPGHSRLPCDRAFALIEKKRRRLDRVSVPSQWTKLVRDAKSENPFTIKYVQYPLTDNLVNDGTEIVTVKDYKTSVSSIVAPVTRIANFRGILFKPTGVFARLSMSGTMDLIVSLLRKGCTWASAALAVRNAKEAYSDFLPISAAKYDDLRYLLSRVSLPVETKFYDTVTRDKESKGTKKKQEDDE